MAKGNKALPFILGIDAAGIVERVGSHVKNIYLDNVSLLSSKWILR